MKNKYFGIDTSNYTSSCAVYDSDTNSFISYKKLLPVNDGQLGLRQSDAVYHHTQNLPVLLKNLIDKCGNDYGCISASYAPRDCDGSYMPCFSVGTGFADVLSASFKCNLNMFSHQAGHIAAALYSSGQTQLIEKEFIAFHVSGGTTDVLLVKPDLQNIFDIRIVAASLDLKAGQAVDRIGGMLGLKFPAGPQLDKLACESTKEFKIKPFSKNGSCSFSGLENKCRQMVQDNCEPCDIAKYCIDYIYHALKIMTEAVLSDIGSIPVIYAGGVMSNSIISARLSNDFDSHFATPEFSSDNACGTAYLGYIKENMR